MVIFKHDFVFKIALNQKWKKICFDLKILLDLFLNIFF